MRRLFTIIGIVGALLVAAAAPAIATTGPAGATTAGRTATTTASFGGVTITRSSLGSGTSQTMFAAPGSTVTVNVGYTIQDVACPGCIDQIEVGWATALPTACVYNGQPGPAGLSGSGSATLTVPSTPGLYYIGYDRSQHYSCAQALATGKWWNSIPDTSRYLAAVAVYPLASPAPTVRGVTLSAVSVSGLGNTAFAAPNTAVRFAANYRIVDTGCPGCIDQIELGFNLSAPTTCLYSGIPGPAGASGNGAVTLTAPATAGVYAIGDDRAQHYSCGEALRTGTWWNGAPDATRTVAAVAVQPYPLP